MRWPEPDNVLPLFNDMDKKPKAFTAPSIDDCVAYGKVIGLSGDECMKFFDRQETIGWLVAVGRTTVPMKNWQAAMRTWKGNVSRFAPQAQQTRPALPVPIWKQIESLKELIANSPANSNSARHNDRCSTEEREKLKGWRATLKALTEQQAKGNK